MAESMRAFGGIVEEGLNRKSTRFLAWPAVNPSVPAITSGVVPPLAGGDPSLMPRRPIATKLLAAGTVALSGKMREEKLVAGVGFEPTAFRL